MTELEPSPGDRMLAVLRSHLPPGEWDESAFRWPDRMPTQVTGLRCAWRLPSGWLYVLSDDERSVTASRYLPTGPEELLVLQDGHVLAAVTVGG